MAPESPLRHKTCDGRTAIGSTFEIQNGNYRSGFFVGIDSQIHDFLMSAPLESLSQIPEYVVEAKHEATDPIYAERRGDGTIIEVWSELIPTAEASSVR
ncbi:MAG TPA: hypothetical protein VE398_10995 [Acidobacteriota bacterium]|nr:hypothetical protein [Acidobacteriota bacterium]